MALAPQDDHEQLPDELKDILAEATQRMNDSARQRKQPPPQDAAARSAEAARNLAEVKFEVDRHRHFSGTASLPGPQFRLTPIRVTAIALGALNVLLWMHYFASDTGPA